MHMNLLQLSPKGRHKHLDRLSIEHFWSWIEIQVHKYNGYMHCIIKNTSMLILACCVPFFFLSTQALLLGEINQLAAENTERKDSWTFAAIFVGLLPPEKCWKEDCILVVATFFMSQPSAPRFKSQFSVSTPRYIMWSHPEFTQLSKNYNSVGARHLVSTSDYQTRTKAGWKGTIRLQGLETTISLLYRQQLSSSKVALKTAPQTAFL